MSPGFLSIILHAHLPYIRHPESEGVAEERWLYEAVAESYVPLLLCLERLVVERVPFGLTLSLSPTLCEMLRDPLLSGRMKTHLLQRAEAYAALAAGGEAGARPSAELHVRLYRQALEACDTDIAGRFGALAGGEGVELITTAATHGFLPLLAFHPGAVVAQIETGLEAHARHFGTRPRGFWLPECGFQPGIETALGAAGCRHTLVDAHGFFAAEPAPRFGCFAPVDLGNGVAAYARDPAPAREVWSPTEGFPADASCRDFHQADGAGWTALKCRRVTGATGPKDYYDPVAAAHKTALQAAQFVESRIAQFRFAASRMDRPPVIVAAYDAELFGHWWFEGPSFIEQVLRLCAQRRGEIETIGLGAHLERFGTAQRAMPGASSWGEHGYNAYWLNEANGWIQPHLRAAAETVRHAVDAAKNGTATPWIGRALTQACRSLLIAQASDWPFIIRRGPHAAYAEQRVRDQLARVHYLCSAVASGAMDEKKLAALETMDAIFPWLDYSKWSGGVVE